MGIYLILKNVNWVLTQKEVIDIVLSNVKNKTTIEVL